MSLTTLLFLAVGIIFAAIGLVASFSFIRYWVKKNLKEKPGNLNVVKSDQLFPPFVNNNPRVSRGYYYAERNRQTYNYLPEPAQTALGDKNNNIRDIRSAKPLRIEVVNYYGLENETNRYYYGN